MKNNSIMGFVALVAMTLLGTATAGAQGTEWSQATACPGWNNPVNFTSGSSANFFWSGQNGSKLDAVPNVLTGTTGMNFNTSTYPLLSASQLATATSGGSCDNTIPSPDKQFVIMSSLTGKDPNTGNLLPYIPWQEFNTNDTTGTIVNTNLTRSIRVGDECTSGKAAALYYNLKVTPDNAMFYIYYSCVIEAPGHGTDADPTFIIRVMRKNAANQWVQVSDTLAYYVPSTPHSTSHPDGTVVIGQNGWHATNSVNWKEWAKVALNLSNHIYENLRIEVLISDCCYTAHLGYAYICGECRPMKITSSGCPPGLSTDVTTLMAPRNMLNYVWYACEYGHLQTENVENPTYTWRQLTPDSSTTYYNYNVQASDFNISRALNDSGIPVIVDSVGNMQSFRCKMTSALDPAKPFDSYLYANVQNTKPTMAVDSLLDCTGGIKLWNRSFVPGAPQLVEPDRTVWSFYNNVSCGGDPDTVVVGDSVFMDFDATDLRGLLVRTNTQQLSDEGECYSEAIYQIKPRFRPKAGMTVDPEVLCDADETTLIDTTTGSNNYREWRFRAADAEAGDMTLSDIVIGRGDQNRTVVRSFTHAVEPIELLVNDGVYYLDFFHANDTVWCDTVVRDTVSVFLHPDLEVVGDTMVCEGNTTDVTVRALGVEGCTYEWSLTLGEITGGLPSGPNLRVVPYADKATYYVKVTSPQGCIAWDSLHAYMVKPKLTMVPDDGRICPGEYATLTGSDAHHYSWTASPADATLAGQEGADEIHVSPKVTTTYTMVGHGANNCSATPLRKTVRIVPLAIPKVKLTPGFIDTDNPNMVLRDVSTYSVASSWLFNDGSYAEGKEVSHRFDNCIGFDSVNVTLTSYNEMNCPIEYPFSIPVGVYTAYFPNAFTPGSNDANDKFSLYTINEYEYFHIYIYNRRGELVYESEDAGFAWDGTRDGEALPQGAYVYTCRFRKPGTTTLSTLQGTVSLIR